MSQSSASDRPRDLFLGALTALFVIGVIAASLACITLLMPGGRMDAIWQLNPDGHTRLLSIGRWSASLMFLVAVACALSVRGLLRRVLWGYWLVFTMLSANLIGDLSFALLRHDPRTLIGLPIAGTVLLFLLTKRVRGAFRAN